MSDQSNPSTKPGVCTPWEERMKEYEQILGDPEVVKQQWEEWDQCAYLYIWFVFTMF